MPADDLVDVTIAIADDALDAVDAIAASLRAIGLERAEVHADIGVITGSVPDDKVSALQLVPGVSAVERGRTVTLLLPKSGVP